MDSCQVGESGRIGERSTHTWFVLKYLLGYPNVRNHDGSETDGERRPDAGSAHLRAAHVNHGRLERSVRPRRGLPPCFLSGSDVRPTLRSRTRPRADRKTRQTTFRSGPSGGIDAALGLRVRTGYATPVLRA